ncbi:hypothetical protein PG990_007595 [Apiospora arundinis]
MPVVILLRLFLQRRDGQLHEVVHGLEHGGERDAEPRGLLFADAVAHVIDEEQGVAPDEKVVGVAPRVGHGRGVGEGASRDALPHFSNALAFGPDRDDLADELAAQGDVRVEQGRVVDGEVVAVVQADVARLHQDVGGVRGDGGDLGVIHQRGLTELAEGADSSHVVCC